MTFKKQESITVPFCVDVSEATYEQYEKIYGICKLYSCDISDEFPRDESDHPYWDFIGVDFEEDVIHWDEVSDYHPESPSKVDVWHNPQTFIDAHELNEELMQKSYKNENEFDMRVVVYYTDGSTYTNKNVKSLQLKDDSLLIYLDTNGDTGFKTTKLDDGVVHNHVFQTESEYLSISTQHLAGYCIMTKGDNKFWTKQFVPLKANFSVEANFVSKKPSLVAQADVSYLPHKQRVQPTGSGSGGEENNSSQLTLGNYEPQDGDYVVVSEPDSSDCLSYDACEEFMYTAIKAGFDRGEGMTYYQDFVRDPSSSICFSIYGGKLYWGYKHSGLKRDVTHLFKD